MGESHPALHALTLSAFNEARVGPLTALPQVLRDLGVEPRRAFTDAGVGLRKFSHPDNRIDHATIARLLSVCAVLTGRSDLGLLVGGHFTLGDFGPIGGLMRHSATAGDALRVFVRHFYRYDRFAVPVLLEAGNSNVLLGYSMLVPSAPGSSLIGDAALAIGHQVLRELCGPTWRATRIHVASRKPANDLAYRRFFATRVRFNAELSGIEFPASWLARRIDRADPDLRGSLGRSLARTESRGPMTFAEESRCALHQLLRAGQASAANLSYLHGISERTLRLRLAKERTSYQQLLNETRFALAQRLLGETRLAMSSIATALGYADSAVFSRAFRDWAGTSPRAWRTDPQALNASGARPAPRRPAVRWGRS